MLYLALLCLLTAPAKADIIALWNFNDAVSGSTGGAFEFLVDLGTGAMSSTFTAGSIGNAGGTLVNAQEDDLAGLALRLSGSGNNGRDLAWMAGTAGYESIVVSFATQRTATGFSRNQFFYSLDAGSSWTAFGDVFDPLASYGLQSFDLGAIAGLNDNPNAAFRIVFDGATSGSGNNRLDNLVVSGTLIPEPPPPAEAVPEPSTMILTLVGLACLCASRACLAGAGRRTPPGGEQRARTFR
jgi:hypothetical protein